jgi:adenylate kinase family enzyme
MDQPRRFDVEPPRRVLIVGNHGAGKRSLARLLADRYGLSPYFVDKEPAAPKLPEPQCADVAAHAAQADWVIATDEAEGVDLAVARAEWLVWIDMPISTCLFRVLRARLRFRRARKQGKAPEHAPRARMRDVLSYPTDLAPRIMQVIDRERRNRTIYILRSRGEVAGFIKRLPGPGKIDDHLRPGRTDA